MLDSTKFKNTQAILLVHTQAYLVWVLEHLGKWLQNRWHAILACGSAGTWEFTSIFETSTNVCISFYKTINRRICWQWHSWQNSGSKSDRMLWVAYHYPARRPHRWNHPGKEQIHLTSRKGFCQKKKNGYKKDKLPDEWRDQICSV